MRHLYTMLSAIILLAGSAAADVYTLEECIQRALETDPAVTEARSAVSTAGAGVWQQYGQFLPTASFGLTSSQTYRGPINRDVWYGENQVHVDDPNWAYQKDYSGGFSFRQTLFDGLQNVWNLMGSRASKRQAEASHAQTKSNLVFAVKSDYYLVLKAKRDLEVAQEAVKRSEELLKLFEEKYELGSASLSEVLKQKVQYGNDRLTLLTAERLLEVRKDQLAIDIGVDPNIDLDVQEIELRKEPLEELPDLIREALQTHPDILAARAGVDAYRYDVRSAWGWYLPSLTLSYSYAWGNNFFGDLTEDVFNLRAQNSGASLRLSLSLNIFDGFTRERNLTRAKSGLTNTRARFIYVRNTVVKVIEDSHLAANLAEETLEVTEETERAASEDFDLVQAKYNLGAAALWELLDAQVSLREAQFNNVKAEFDYNLALAKLQNAMGK